ncbi:MAG: transglutaminase domain-containing protein [Opitutales bacterium]
MTPLTLHPAFWFALALGLLFIANLYVFLTREWEASHSAVDYAQIYYPLDVPTLRRWRFLPGNRIDPVIAWNRTPAQWELLVDGRTSQLLPGAAPAFALTGPLFDGTNDAPIDDFRHTYVLRPLPAGSGPDLAFNITSISREFYRQRGMHFPIDPQIVKTEVPAGNFKRHPLARWVDDYRYLGPAALAEADRILREEMQVSPTDAPLVRMEKIIRTMRAKWIHSGGVPKDDYRWQSPLHIYQELSAGTGKGWCTQNAQVYAFFANRAGVVTRFVFGATVQSNRIVYNGHSWAESFLPDEGAWGYVDPQSSIITVRNRAGRLLNSADLFHLLTLDTLDGVTAHIFKDWNWPDLPVTAAPGEPVDVPFALVNRVARIEATPQTIIKYRRPPNVEDVRDLYGMLLRDRTFAWTNLKRYLFEPAPAYSLMPTNGPRNYLLRRTLFGALLVSLGLLVAALV